MAHRRRFATVVYIAFLCCSLIPKCALNAATFYVRATGNDQADGTSPGAAFATLVRAAQVFANGDQIIIGPGTYRGDVVLGNCSGTVAGPLAIIGDESGKQTGDVSGTVILQPIAPGNCVLSFDRADHLKLSGLTFRSASDSATGGQGIQLWQCKNVLVERCTFDRLSRGVAIAESADIRVETCVAARCTIGFFLQATRAARLAQLSVAGCSSQGVLLLACSTGQITNCLFAANNITVSADAVSANSWTCDHNVIHGASGPWGGSVPVQNIYEWNASSGQDRHSAYVVPAFVDPARYDLHIDPHVTWPGGLPGQHAGALLDPMIDADRDGQPFLTDRSERDRKTTCVGAYAYPTATPGPGWKEVSATTVAGDTAVRQSAAIYAPDGSLVSTLLADATGVRGLYWNGLDDQGQPVPAGSYEVRTVGHDVRVRDDGYIGNSGTAAGAFDPADAIRAVTFEGNRFAVCSGYDESGMIVRTFSATGKPMLGDNLFDRNFAGLAMWGKDILAVAGENEKAHLLRLALPGNVTALPSGAMDHQIFASGEKPCPIGGLAVVGDEAFVSLPALNIVRALDIQTGKKRTDLPLPAPADIASDGHGGLWAISGKQVVALTITGQIGRRVESGLATPTFIAASDDRLAVVDRPAARIAVIDADSGKIIKSLGRARGADEWAAVSSDILRDPRGVAFTGDGRLMITENGRIRSIWLESGKIASDLVAEFLDTAVPHPAKPDYVYTGLGVYHVDPQTHAWQWLVEAPFGPAAQALGMPSRSVMLGGKPFLAYYGESLRMFDVSDPQSPRLALKYPPAGQPNVLSGWTYSTICFGKDGSIIAGSNESLRSKRIAFTGLDSSGNPQFDFAHPIMLGADKDPLARGMTSVDGNAVDPATGDHYFLAKSALYNKMVPGWGADGTGVGKMSPQGKPLWFSRSSGGNYMAIDCVSGGKEPLIMACKSFGGQIDLFDSSGLRLTTGNWSAPCDYAIGFVDQRYGLTGYVRSDGKPGAYVEDDAIGRLVRARVDGADTITRSSSTINWDGGAPAGPPPMADVVASPATLTATIPIPKISPLPVDGDFSRWEKAGIAPQIVCLPSGVGFIRNFPPDLLTTFRQGTALGAVAHDGANLYVYFLVADDAMHFDAAQPADMWAYNGIEFWAEEEQFGIGFVKDGTPTLFKYRDHNRSGESGKAGYLLERQNVWGKQYADLSANPLARQLSSITGVNFDGKGGYALMAKIPFEEVKLVAGVAGRAVGAANTTGSDGEIIRLGVAIGEITAVGRQQDYKVNWPAGLMFADPSRSQPFVFGK